MKPGDTEKVRIPFPEYSAARASVNPRTACLAVAYAANPFAGRPDTAAVSTFTIVPWPARSIGRTTARALDQLAKLNQVRAGSYEVRLLRFSAILLMAIWLKSDTGDPDIIYPLAPAPDVLQADKPCSADDFLKAIMPVAKARAAKKASPAVP